MTVNLSALAGAGQQFFDNNGIPLSGGKLWSYQAGTTTPQTTYTTAAGNVAHTNPIILDSAGRVSTGEIWLTAGNNYKFVLMTSVNVTLATWDNITGVNGTGITANAENVQYDPPFANAQLTNVEAKLAEYVSVKDFGAVGNGSNDDTQAIKNAIATGRAVYFPAGSYLITSTINSNGGAWIGDGSGSTYDSTPANGVTIIKLSGTNGGAAFLNPPSKFEGFHVDGQTSNNIGIRLGTPLAFTGFLNWKNIKVRRCDIGFDTYNFFSCSWENIAVQSCQRGVRMDPPDNVGVDDGYFTSTDWLNIHIADCSVYGLYVRTPQGTRTWTWNNVVIERNGTSGTYQMYIDSASVTIIGGYFEGSSLVPAIKMFSSNINLTSGYFNGTGGIDGSSSNNGLTLQSCIFVSSTDTLNNFSGTSVVLAFEGCNLRTDPRTFTSSGNKNLYFRSCLFTGTSGVPVMQTPGIAVSNYPYGSGVDINPTPITYTLAYKKSVTGVVAANSTLRVIFNEYVYGLWTSDTTATGNLDTYHPGLLVQITAADSGSPDYFCVFLVNTTASPITLGASEKLVVSFLKHSAIQL